MHHTPNRSLLSRSTVALASSLAVLASCGTPLQNSNLPKTLRDLAPDANADREFEEGGVRWNALLNALKLSPATDENALRIPTQFLQNQSASHELHDTLTETLKLEHLKTAQRTQCAEVVAMEELGAAKKLSLSPFSFGNLDGARWYLMKYKRKKETGETDSTINGAIVSVPDSAGSYPLIAYAHAGDQGLSQFELAGVFAEEQLNYIIVAPAFPGEGITAAQTFAAVGTSEPYSTDAEDLLAAHNCIIDTVQVPDALLTVRNKIKRRTSGNFVGSPVSATIGVSRGGMASLIAHAKNESLLRSGLPEAKRFSCAATVINPTSLTFGEFRVYLETIVRGKAELTGFYSLPTAPQLNTVLKDYRNGGALEDALISIQKRDATFNSQLILSSLRNWSTGGKGSILFMHGTLDQKIPHSQGVFGSFVFDHVNQRLTNNGSIPGVQLTSLSFVPESFYTSSDGKTLISGQTMHGDESWFSSRAKFKSVTDKLQTLELSALDTSEFGYNKLPLDVLKDWLKNTTLGCASTY